MHADARRAPTYPERRRVIGDFALLDPAALWEESGVGNPSLPIWQLHDEIVGALTHGNRLVLVAPTGSGKTTQVPQMLLDAGLLDPARDPALPSAIELAPTAPRDAPPSPIDAQAIARAKRIVVLQPRRVAARTVAARVAWERGVTLGAEVGYQIRFDDQSGLGTRICFVTEGILLRWLQDDPALGQVGILLFDEFHERNLLGDLALGLAKHMQATTRPDLKLAVMSATLDAAPVAAYLDDCPILISEGRSWPVETRFLEQPDARALSEQAADTVGRIVRSGAPGDVLVFMPGMAEIHATLRALEAAPVGEPLALLPLHGDLPPEDQDRAFAPQPRRKVVVATNVAETSVTIEGIRHVVDSGQARVARYDAERGLQTLALEPISRASADQRQGRAGRTAPGTCHRLWTESGHLDRPERNTPEIQRSDLAEVVLLLHSLGIRRAVQFDWLDRPDPRAVERAEMLLVILGALAPEESASPEIQPGAPAPSGSRETSGPRQGSPALGDLTPLGRRMLRLPMHPRYARMLLEAARYGCVPAAALCAALVSGRDLLFRLGREDDAIAQARELFETSGTSDFFTLMRAYEFAKQRRFGVEACRRHGLHAQTARQVEQTFEQIVQIAARERLVAREQAGLVPDSEPGPGPAPVSLEVPGSAPAEASAAHPRRQVEAAPPLAARSAPDAADEPLLRCLLAGFADQLCVRRGPGSLECDLTEGRSGTLVRESVVQDAPLFVAASVREVAGRGGAPRTLVSLATAVKREWLAEMFPSCVTARIEHLFDRTHKRVAAVNLVRFQDLLIHHEHQREIDPDAAGACLADAFAKGWFELPLFNHALRQFVARVNLVCAALPELEFPALHAAGVATVLARALRGVATVKEAQATHLLEAFRDRLAPEQRGWLDELAPLSIVWPDGHALKLLYTDADPAEDRAPGAELSVKLHECFALKEHPHLCEGRVPVTLWLAAPDGKRIESTRDWPAFRANRYPQLRRALAQKYPGVAWP